ncbi:MAG: FtsK/SpoIIIE domain-containing protein [Schumannella sp.]
MAHGRSPREVAFLLVDFQGGAAFAPLAGLPHVAGITTDLDARLTRRAVESLRAELVRRERILLDSRVRSIDELAPGHLARLVVVVDEYAALVAAAPELHEVFADIAARGRSLGMHLILCTQRPSGVVRDAVLANIGLRIALRVTDRADSTAVLGGDDAARLPAEPRGRALVHHDGATHELQVALAGPGDVTAAGAAAGRAEPPSVPWCDPLPRELDAALLPPAASGELGFGIMDLPAQQRQPLAAYRPAADGSLLVLGGPGAGVTTALAMLADAAKAAGRPVRVLSPEPADAWAALSAPLASRTVVIADALDALLARFGPDERQEAAGMLTALMRDGSAALVAGARRIDGEIGRLAGQFGSRLVLRMASREDHVMAGADAASWDPSRSPGSGLWRGAETQVARRAGFHLPAPDRPAAERVNPESHPVLAVVATRPAEWAPRLAAAGWRVVELAPGAQADAAPAAPAALLGDPDAWGAAWAIASRARREWSIAFVGCAASDHRALIPGGATPPPLGADPRECWLVAGGRTVRAVLEVPEGLDGTHENEAKTAAHD